MEIQWALLDPRGSFRLVVPALALTGPASLVSLGPAFGAYRKGTTSGSGGGTSSPGGQGPGPGAPTSAGHAAAVADNEVRQAGLGDARLQLRRQVGRDAGWGRIFLDGGAKLPTADAQKGLGTGEPDFWGGLAWKYEGWVANIEAYLEWVNLGDPPGLPLQDGPGAGCFVEFPGGRGGFGVGLVAAQAAVEGDSARVQAVVDGYRRGGTIEWGLAASGGLTASAPDLGLSLSLRY
jgi:hypothetical protein